MLPGGASARRLVAGGPASYHPGVSSGLGGIIMAGWAVRRRAAMAAGRTRCVSCRCRFVLLVLYTYVVFPSPAHTSRILPPPPINTHPYHIADVGTELLRRWKRGLRNVCAQRWGWIGRRRWRRRRPFIASPTTRLVPKKPDVSARKSVGTWAPSPSAIRDEKIRFLFSTDSAEMGDYAMSWGWITLFFLLGAKLIVTRTGPASSQFGCRRRPLRWSL